MPNARSQKQRTKREVETLDLLPKAEALKRADDLLRAMLNSPPDPFTPKPTPMKRARK